MLNLRYRWKGKCPRHPRYNPAKVGVAGIKGNCPTCGMLAAIYDAHRRTIQHATNFDEVQRVGGIVSAIRTASVRAFEEAPRKPS